MNKQGILTIIMTLSSIYLFHGCGNIEQTIYLQDVHVSGPINQPPLHLTVKSDSNKITLSPKIFINTANNLNGQVDGHSKVNSNGTYQMDTIFSGGVRKLRESGNNIYDFTGNNFHWAMPDAEVGIDFDIRLSKVIAFIGGLNYSIINQERLTGGSLGFGMFANQKNSGNRFDIGMMWQEMHYNASSVVVTTYQPVSGPSSQSVVFYKDKDKFTTYNFYGTWAYNSVNSVMPFDYYFGFGFYGQTVVNFKPTEFDMGTNWSGNIVNDNRSEVTTSYLMFMIGIYENISENNRLSFGVRVLKEFQIKNLSESLYLFPAIQLDMVF